jgi:hypothetical protein
MIGGNKAQMEGKSLRWRGGVRYEWPLYQYSSHRGRCRVYTEQLLVSGNCSSLVHACCCTVWAIIFLPYTCIHSTAVFTYTVIAHSISHTQQSDTVHTLLIEHHTMCQTPLQCECAVYKTQHIVHHL